MDRSTIRSRVLGRLGRPTTDALIDTTTINDAINDALHLIAAEYPWPWLEASENISTTNGTESYTPSTAATTYIETIGLRIAGNPPMIRMSKEELDRQFPSTASGTPVAYAVYGRQIFVRPIPITSVLPTLVHTYHRDEADLSADGNSPLMVAVYHPAIVEVTAGLMARRAGDMTRAASFERTYAEVWRPRMIEHARRSRNEQVGDGIVPVMPQSIVPGEQGR